MSGYQLKATDGSGSYSIPKGETVIGRGPFLAIADKRVSRSHAILEVVDNKLRIKPVHVNPCFYQASDKSKFVPLERNEWHGLNSGDCFSLLPEKYSFQVIEEHTPDEATLRNSQAFDDDCAVENGSACSPVTLLTNIASDEPSSKTPDDCKPILSPSSSAACSSGKNETCDDLPAAVRCKDVEQSEPASRKRILPGWMLQVDLPIQSLTSPVTKAGKKKRKTVDRNISATKNVESTVEKQQMSSKKLEKESLKTESCGVEAEVSAGTSSANLPGSTVLASSHSSPIQNNEEEEMGADSCDNTPEFLPPVTTSESLPVMQHKPSNSKATTSEDHSLSPVSPTQQATKMRAPCMYGERCYRKNPVHFQEFSHPGDSDYTEDGSQDDSDNRPECPYGTDCYRKNPQHKLEYKHTKPPARSVLDDDSDNDGNPNAYDLNDSFIDDDDEEEDFDNTDEDSDYVPDSEEREREDIKQLLKEAKRFVKRKR